MNQLLERSHRKVTEAAFFLDRLSETKGRHPEFGYYLSAFLSALRSVGFVLQTDLRRRFGLRFNDWWERAKASLQMRRIPFPIIVELRNQALKTGELLPGLRVVARIDHPSVEEVTFTLDLRHGQIRTAQEDVHVSKQWCADGATGTHNPDGSDKLIEQLIPALRDVFRSLNEDEPLFEVSSLEYQVDRSGPAVSFTEMVEGFAEHVAAMQRLVAEADALFRINDPKPTP